MRRHPIKNHATNANPIENMREPVRNTTKQNTATKLPAASARLSPSEKWANVAKRATLKTTNVNASPSQRAMPNKNAAADNATQRVRNENCGFRVIAVAALLE